MRRMVKITDPGAHGKANVGISNDKRGEIPLRHKSKVSRAIANQPGVSRVLSLSRTARAMAETVNIPLLPSGATWRRSSDTAAGRRKSPLKSVGVDWSRQIHSKSRP